MKVDTIKGSSYVMTCTKACTVHAVLSSSVDLMLVLEAGKAGQYGFVAPTDAVEISDENAFVIQIFKTPVPRLFVQDGVQPGEDAILKNMMAESGTFAGTVNANGGVRVPLPHGPGGPVLGLHARRAGQTGMAPGAQRLLCRRSVMGGIAGAHAIPQHLQVFQRQCIRQGRHH